MQNLSLLKQIGVLAIIVGFILTVNLLADSLEFSTEYAIRSSQIVASVVVSARADQDRERHVQLREDEREVQSLTNTLILQSEKEGRGRAASQAIISSANQIKKAKERAQFMETVASGNPEVFLRNVLPARVRAKLSIEVQAVTEKEVDIVGPIEVLHVDDFSNEGGSHFKYHIRVGNSRLALYLAGEAPALESGSILQVKGYQVGQTVVAASDSGSVKVLSRKRKKSSGLQRMLVVLVTPSSMVQTTKPNPDTMRRDIFFGTFQKFYKEQSYGNVSFAGDVTDWISVPASSHPGCASPQLDQPEVKSYIIQKGINLSNYERVVFVVNGWVGGCAFVGKLDWSFNGASYSLSQGWVGWPNAEYVRSGMSGFEYVLAHEVGHEIGVMHANAWSCRGTSLDMGCYHSEYGNPYDVMGTGYYASHFNAFYKDILGWLSTSSKVSITKSGSYTLAPIETQKGVRAAIINNPGIPSAAPLYLEFRRPIGFDSTLPLSSAGIHINQIVAPQYGFPFPRLLNANYATDPASQQALIPGGTFAWDSRGIMIGSFTATPSSAKFRVTLRQPVCHRLGIGITDTGSRTTFAAGSSGYLTFTLTNNDSIACTSSTISIVPSVASSIVWAISHYPADPVTLAPGDSEYVTIVFFPPVDAGVGDYVLRAVVTDTTNGRSYNIERTITTVLPPQIHSIAPERGRAGSAVTLFGSRFVTESSATEPSMTNTILIQSSTTLESTLRNIPTKYSSSTTFVFPTMMDNFFGKGISNTSVPTPIGIYTIYLQRDSDGAISNSVSFEVSSSTGAGVMQ